MGPIFRTPTKENELRKREVDFSQHKRETEEVSTHEKKELEQDIPYARLSRSNEELRDLSSYFKRTETRNKIYAAGFAIIGVASLITNGLAEAGFTLTTYFLAALFAVNAIITSVDKETLIETADKFKEAEKESSLQKIHEDLKSGNDELKKLSNFYKKNGIFLSAATALEVIGLAGSIMFGGISPLIFAAGSIGFGYLLFDVLTKKKLVDDNIKYIEYTVNNTSNM